MIYVLEGNDFLVQDFIQEHKTKKFKGVPPEQLKFSIVENPTSLSDITEISPFGADSKMILWDFNEFKKLETFNPYIIPKAVDIFIVGFDIDKRLKIVKSLETFNAKFHQFKDLYPSQVESWILGKCKNLELKITGEAVKQLAFYYGSNLGEIQTLLKSFINLHKEITRTEILQYCSCINQFSIFELEDLVAAKSTDKAVFVVKQMMKSGDESVKTLRYFMSYYNNLLLLKSGVEIKVHNFVLMKLKKSSITREQCIKALDILRDAERKIFRGIDKEYQTVKAILYLTKTI
jgi:DNA polymerase III delta subunit